MNDINRRQMKDVIVPQNDVIRRPAIVPEQVPTPKSNGGSRIEQNPFFDTSRPKPTKPAVKKSGSGAKGAFGALIFALVLALAFIIADHYATATVEIVPITRTADVDAAFVVPREGAEGEFVFSTATLTEEKKKEVAATIEKKIQKKASGKVVIYNSYSAASQNLVINTRLESPDRKIYRISKSVNVPGVKIVGGKSVPGSVEVLVYADAAGESYNIGVSNFTIPGFKGDPRYSKFSAVSKPDSPIAGGFSGTVKVPSDEVILQAREELKQDLKKIVAEKMRAQIPPEASFFPGSMIIKFEEVPQDLTDATNVSVRAVTSVFFFDTELLTQKLVAAALPEDKGKTFSIPEMSDLSFSFVDPVDSVVLADLTKLKFRIAGKATFMGKVDVDKVRASLAGKNKKDFTQMIIDQNNIYKADAVVRPVWKTMFPSDATKIAVKIVAK